MTTQDIDDYLYYEFDVHDPKSLSDRDRIIAYERLKHKMAESDITPDQFTSEIIKISEYLEI